MASFEITAGTLAKAIARISAVVPNRTTIPILSHIKISAKAGLVTLEASSLDIAARTTEAANVSADGVTAVPLLVASRIVSGMPKDKAISVSWDAGTCHIKCGRSAYKMQTLDAADFPEMHLPIGGNEWRMSPEALARALDQTSISVATEDPRFYLRGVYVHAKKGGGIILVATNGHQLSRTSAEIDGTAPKEGIIIPTPAVRIIKAICEDAGDEITLVSDQSRILVKTPQTTVSAALIDGSFPDYERVIPIDPREFASVGSTDLLQAIERSMSIYAGQNTIANRLQITANGGGISITSHGNVGEGAEFVECETSDHVFACDGIMLKGLLGSWGDASLTLRQHDKTSPLVITSDDDPKTLQVLMPMK